MTNDEYDLTRIPWGKELTWGIVERTVRTRGYKGELQARYAVVENGVAVFAGRRCIAKDLSHEEASALCAIMNMGGSDG